MPGIARAFTGSACEVCRAVDHARLQSPSAARNKGPILKALRPHLPPAGLVLEVASGTGEHVAHFATALAALQWQPSDPDGERRASIDAWTAGLGNVLPALDLDVGAAEWPIAAADAVLCINMMHIAPWAATQGLMVGAARVLAQDGVLAVYGPFRRGGEELAPGNAAFDAELRARDLAWGLRVVEEVAALATAVGFGPARVVTMPADNRLVLWAR